MKQTPARTSLGPAALFLSLAAVTGCGPGKTEPVPPLDAGRAVYERSVGGLACADCHGESATPRTNPDWKPSGHPLAGVASRPQLWGGRFEGEHRLQSAALYCAARFQYREIVEVGPPQKVDPARYSMTAADREHLLLYLGTFEGPAEAVSTRRDADVDPALELEGDFDRGEQLWMSACAICHGDEAEGGLGPSLSGDDATDAFTFAEYVRSGSLDDEDGWMPHFRKDRLSDQDLADLAIRWTE